jgi:hypothetical protein
MLNPTGKFARSWALFTSTFHVMRQHPRLLLFPVITAACSLVIAVFFLAPTVLYPTGHSLTESAHWLALATRFGWELDGDRTQLHPNALFYGYAATIYLVSMFIATFANVAFYHQIMQALAGQPVSIRAGVRFAGTRLPSILVWSLFAGLVGLIIQQLEERFGLVGRWVMKFVGVIWSVASVFAIPVIIRDGSTNPVAMLRDSAATLRKTWGESLIGYAGLTVVSWLVGIGPLLLFVLAFALAVTVDSGILVVLTIVTWLAGTITLGYLASVAGHIYRCALYVYASEGVVPAPYSADMMNLGWKVKKS